MWVGDTYCVQGECIQYRMSSALVLASSRPAAQLSASGAPVETSITPAEILAITPPQLGPILAAVYKLVVVEGWLHHTAGERKRAKDGSDLLFLPELYGCYLYTRLLINTLQHCPLRSHRVTSTVMCCGCDCDSPSGPEAVP